MGHWNIRWRRDELTPLCGMSEGSGPVSWGPNCPRWEAWHQRGWLKPCPKSYTVKDHTSKSTLSFKAVNFQFPLFQHLLVLPEECLQRKRPLWKHNVFSSCSSSDTGTSHALLWHFIFILHFIKMYNVKTWKGLGTFQLGNWKDTTAYMPLKPDSISHKGKKRREWNFYKIWSILRDTATKGSRQFCPPKGKEELMASCTPLEN